MSTPRAMIPGLIACLLTAATQQPPIEQRAWLESGSRESSVDVLFVGDGYTEKDLARSGKYWKDVERCSKRLFQSAPFSFYKSRFNVRAAFVESKEAGCDRAENEDEVDTALDCRFDTREGRLLVFKNSSRLKTVVEQCGAADIVFVMVNTERYGGAGTLVREIEVRGRALPAPTFAAQDTRSFLIALHELGHSFADLGDEYADETEHARFPMPAEGDLPWANLTLESAFESGSFERLQATVKWRHFLELPEASKHKWHYAGGYYRERGVFRPWRTCRMRDNEDPFCPICCEVLARSIHAACGLPWDDAAWHAAHPLSEWR